MNHAQEQTTGNLTSVSTSTSLIPQVVNDGSDNEDPIIYYDYNGQHPHLVPAMGTYPLSQVHFSTLVMNQSPVNPRKDNLTVLDLTDILNGKDKFEDRFNKPFEALRLTYEQSWYTQGVELGRLLYTFPLAPGEFMRIAVSHWARQERGSQAENQRASESLNAETIHQRSIDQINNAVSHEASSGFSDTTSDSTSHQSGDSGGFSIGPFGGGSSSSQARSKTIASSFVTGTTDKNFSTQMSQRILDTNRQHSSAVRSSFATVIREVKQEENQNIKTRVIGNYNHMFPVTHNYYEMLQIFRIDLKLVAAEKVLLIPTKPLERFTDKIVQDNWAVLYRAALTKPVADYLKAKYSECRTDVQFNILDHLNTNTNHYSMAIYANLKPDMMLHLLSDYRYSSPPNNGGPSLSSLVHPTPVAVIGNLLGLSLGGCYAEHSNTRVPGQINTSQIQRDVKALMNAYGFDFDQVSSTYVKLPTQGVFLESVRGINNSKECIDPTRAAQWDAPPVLPTEIAPIQMRTPEMHQPQLQAAAMQAPIVCLQTPSHLPNPVDYNPTFMTFLQQSLMSDLTRLQECSTALAATNLESTNDSARHQATLAGQNMQRVIEGTVQKMAIARDMMGMMYGVPPQGGSNSSQNSSHPVPPSSTRKTPQISQSGRSQHNNGASQFIPQGAGHMMAQHGQFSRDQNSRRHENSKPKQHQQLQNSQQQRAPSLPLCPPESAMPKNTIPDCSATGIAVRTLQDASHAAQNTRGSGTAAALLATGTAAASSVLAQNQVCNAVNQPTTTASPKVSPPAAPVPKR